MKPINDMTPTELKITCAQWMERKVLDDEESDDLITFPLDYEHDRNATMELVMAVPEDKVNNFIRALEKILFDRDLPAITLDWVYRIMIVDSLIIMRAFLTVMEDK